MNQKATESLLGQRINEVLYYLWDPIGVSGMGPAPRDEYDSYADQVWRMVLAGKSKLEISNYLTDVTMNHMGMGVHKKHDDEIAELVLDWYDYLKHGLDR